MKQPDLLDPMLRAAVISDDGVYRYELERGWDPGAMPLVCCMLNPSTADHQVDDPTIQALIHFAKLWGYGGLLIVNLFAFRSSSPTVMMSADDPVGPENQDRLEKLLKRAAELQAQVLVAWGNDGGFEGGDQRFIARAAEHGVDLVCLGQTQHGHPKHPMARGLHRIPRDQQPIPFIPRAA